MNLPYEIHTLPYFRVIGISARIHPENRESQLAQLWHAFSSGSLKNRIPAFSQTIYCVYHDYADDGSCTAVIGKLVATDKMLPEDLSEVWIAPQQYAVFTLPENSPSAAQKIWQTIQQDTHLDRRFHRDFESFPAHGAARIYVGLNGAVEMDGDI